VSIVGSIGDGVCSRENRGVWGILAYKGGGSREVTTILTFLEKNCSTFYHQLNKTETDPS
jgi:hypothetical protein